MYVFIFLFVIVDVIILILLYPTMENKIKCTILLPGGSNIFIY
jgi:hypothetical protein